MTDHEAYILLNLMGGIGPARLSALLGFCGQPSEIFRTSARDLASVQGISEALADKIVHWEDHVDLAGELDLAERGGARIITRGEGNTRSSSPRSTIRRFVCMCAGRFPKIFRSVPSESSAPAI